MEAAQQNQLHFFQGDRTPGEIDKSPINYPRTTDDPGHSRGVFIPGIGLLAPQPNGKTATPSLWVAKITALSAGADGGVSTHVDPFANGDVGFTIGRFLGNDGAWQEAADLAKFVAERDGFDAPLGNRYVNLLLRADTIPAKITERMPGLIAPQGQTRLDPQMPRYQITAGDMLKALELVGTELPEVESAAQSKAAPFSGPFERPQLVFNGTTGALVPTRLPTPKDIEFAHAWAQPQLGPDGQITQEYGEVLVPVPIGT